VSESALGADTDARPWMVSLHGGHSGAYCDHATGALRSVLEAAVDRGFQTFGVSEHAPRVGEHLLYQEERDQGWNVAKLEADFARYCRDVRVLAEEFSDRLIVLRGFEIEVAPKDRYVELMRAYRERHGFEYIVGSVHFLEDVSIDGPKEEFDEALEMFGGLEGLACAYYDSVAQMVDALKPEVVGHLDLIRKNAPSNDSVDTPLIRRAVEKALEAILANDGILDVNTAGYRKGLGSPYPAPWVVDKARRMGIGFCFGDDSHGPDEVGAGIEEGRRYLVDNGVDSITILTRSEGEVVRKLVSLA